MTSSRDRVLLVPGLSVRRYAFPAVRALRRRGYATDVLAAPAWPRTPSDPRRYGALLAEQLEVRDLQVPLLVGLSVGSEAAAVAATLSDRIQRLLLVSPTVDPKYRTHRKLLAAWLFGSEGDAGPGMRVHAPDWARGGPRILAGLHHALGVRLEDELPWLRIPITLVHAEFDPLGSPEFAEHLADTAGARMVHIPNAPHSWPYGHAEQFADLVEEITR